MYTNHNKTLNNLTLQEINSLISNSRLYGFMKLLMKNLKNKKIERPEKINVFYKRSGDGEIVAWFLVDAAGELCSNLIEPEVSVMLYTSHKHRKLGFMKSLITDAKSALKDKILKVYVDPWEIEFIAIKKLGTKFNLTIQSHTTSYELKLN